MSRSEFERKTYLGDGVYSEFDGYQIKLTVENGSQYPTDTIYLEPEVVLKLMEHISRISLYKGLKNVEQGIPHNLESLIIKDLSDD